ncbi:MAG: sigma-70 family RNA polymerase sigma factor [Planctomycetaceae bacterium]
MSDDASLVERSLAGDSAALGELVDRFQQPVFALCLKLLRHRQDAEDVAQESLVRMCRHLATYDVTRPLISWVLAIAANRCRTAIEGRSRRPIPVEEVPAVAAPLPEITSLPEEVDQALSTLRPEIRTCMILFYLNELSLAEISETMDVPIGTLKTWLHRGRNELSAKLPKNLFD